MSQHSEHLRKIFARLREFGLKLSKEKSEFAKDRIRFLSHEVTKEGVKPDKERLKAILETQPLKDLKEVRRFLGMINYY